MQRAFFVLPVRKLGSGAGLRRPVHPQAARVSLESPARDVMTDFTHTSPATIRPQAPLSGANRFMITRGVRLLLVVDDHERVLGLITATDLLGARPVRVATERGLHRDELTVGDVMTPAEAIEVVDLEEVDGARVGHVLETLRRDGRQHALVVDTEVLPPAGPLERPVRRTLVRGVFSLSQIARQLGVAIQPGAEVAHTFSEIEAAIR